MCADARRRLVRERRRDGGGTLGRAVLYFLFLLADVCEGVGVGLFNLSKRDDVLASNVGHRGELGVDHVHERLHRVHVHGGASLDGFVVEVQVFVENADVEPEGFDSVGHVASEGVSH